MKQNIEIDTQTYMFIEEFSMEKSKYFEILYLLMVNGIKFKRMNEAKITIKFFFDEITDPGMV